MTLEHRVPLAMAGSGAGAFYVGPGWDGALLGLALYVDGIVAEDPVAAANTLEAQQFCASSIDAWQGVVEASGTADQEADRRRPGGRPGPVLARPRLLRAQSPAANIRPSGSSWRSSREEIADS